MDTNPIFLQQPSQIGFAGDITHISLLFTTDFPSNIQKMIFSRDFPSDIQAKTESVVTRPLRDPGISRDPGIFSKSRSRDSQKSNPGIFWDFQKPLNDCIPRLSTT